MVMICRIDLKVNILSSVVTLAAMVGLSSEVSAIQRPNILLIMTDQHHAGWVGYAGNPHVRTPALDNLAREGIIFTRAYTASPLCVPARTSLFTGLYPHVAGVSSNEQENKIMEDEIRSRSLGFLMKDAGYDCVYAGKWHAHTPAMDNNNGFRSIHGFTDIGLADACIEYLNTKQEEPFFLIASFDNPHNICEWARSQPLPYGNVSTVLEAVDEYPPLPDNFEPGALEPEAIRIEQYAMPKLYPTKNFTDKKWREYLYIYSLLIEKVDTEIGKILKHIQREGYMDNTIIIFCSDHGDGAGSHRWNQKTVLYEHSIQVPLVLYEPEYLRNKKLPDRTGNLVNIGIDITPTILNYAGADLLPEMPGLALQKQLSCIDSVHE